jgi:HAD superfamily hydrolase (TIGR01484 family)
MKGLQEFINSGLRFVFTDIDDTLTDAGQLSAAAYQALWRLHDSGISVVPVTGRPAGWCELIARQWPVAGVVGENGGFYFRYADRSMKRQYFFNAAARIDHNRRLEKIRTEILARIPGAAVASDQFCRQMDLAIDYCEDVPGLPPAQVDRIVSIFKGHGAHAKVSSIHVNGWFGDYDKLVMCRMFLEKEFSLTLDSSQSQVAFVGDSPNDEPMFGFFENSFAVANIKHFVPAMKALPKYVAKNPGGAGFAEIVERILAVR